MAISFTFGNHLKFGPDSYHKTKGRPTFLHRERERALEALREPYTFTLREASNGPCVRASCRHGGWSNEGPRRWWFFPLPKIEAERRQYGDVFTSSKIMKFQNKRVRERWIVGVLVYGLVLLIYSQVCY